MVLKLKSIFLLLTFLCATVQARECFIVVEKEKKLRSEGQCQAAHAPQSTFKIALALMGFDSQILKDEARPAFPFSSEYSPAINVCKSEHNPRTWMRDSCVWYSQVMTRKLGMEKFRQYVTKFNYGNSDVTGDPGKNNGLTQSWLSSSLQITPQEQIKFLQNMLNKKLGVSEKALELTKKILFIQELPGGWKLFGKTGNGRYKGDLQQGWFVGWIEKGPRQIIFVHHLVDDKKEETYASFRSKNSAVTKLWYVIDELEMR
jgi:beta-lactamase class D